MNKIVCPEGQYHPCAKIETSKCHGSLPPNPGKYVWWCGPTWDKLALNGFRGGWSNEPCSCSVPKYLADNRKDNKSGYDYVEISEEEFKSKE